MKIYTKTGDSGDTGLFAGPRVRKDDCRIEAFGAVDEVNALLGLTRCEPLFAELATVVARLQHELFDVGAELATPDPARAGLPQIGEAHVAALECDIDAFEDTLPPLKQFILPGGSRAASLLHLARTVCRRAERRITTLSDQAPINRQLLAYVNRLSDLLFVLARAANASAGLPDVPWAPTGAVRSVP